LHILLLLLLLLLGRIAVLHIMYYVDLACCYRPSSVVCRSVFCSS